MSMVNFNGATIPPATALVEGAIDPDLFAARAAQDEVIVKAQAAVQAAQERVNSFHATMPPDDASEAVVRDWARDKATLAVELDVYQARLRRAQQKAAAIQHQIDEAYRQSWFDLHAQAIETFNGHASQVQQRVRDAEKQLEAMREQGTQELRALASKVTALRNCMPNDVPLSAVATTMEINSGRMF